jgi:hypothetical protein
LQGLTAEIAHTYWEMSVGEEGDRSHLGDDLVLPKRFAKKKKLLICCENFKDRLSNYLKTS